MLVFVVIWMTAIMGFSAGKMVYDLANKDTITVTNVSSLDTVYSVASTKINIEK